MKKFNKLEDRTEEIRTMLTFILFIENKVIGRNIYNFESNEIGGFTKFVAMYLK